MPSDTELPEGDEQQTAWQAAHTAQKTRAQSGQAPVKRTVTDRATETFRTTWIKKQLVKIQLTKIKFDTDLTRAEQREGRGLNTIADRKPEDKCTLPAYLKHSHMAKRRYTTILSQTHWHCHTFLSFGHCNSHLADISHFPSPCGAFLSQLQFPTSWAGLIP